MALDLYCRHSRKPGKCLAGHPPDAPTYEAEERRRRAKKCACPIAADRTLAGRFKRQNTKRFESRGEPGVDVVLVEADVALVWTPPSP